MTESAHTHHSNLFLQQAWVMRLRWLAGSLVVIGGLVEHFWLHWYHTGLRIALLGAAILSYNLLLRCISHRLARQSHNLPRNSMHALVWFQILADLVCLTLLTAWTGDYDSPLRGLFVCHMVFASLLFDRFRAFGIALVAIGMVEGTLLLFAGHAPSRVEVAIGTGWDLTLLALVYLTSRVAQSLRFQRRRLILQNKRIRKMSNRLQRQQQLMIQQEKMIAMGQMAAGVAHEVANPLASMDGLLQLLERRPEKVSPDNIARLRQQIARVTAIVRQLTDFAHPGGDWEDASVNDVVTKALAVLRFDRRLKHATIETHLDPAVPVMRIQPAALEQVVINMAINAADAMDGLPSPRLEIRTILSGDEIILTLSDNGIGIPPDIRDRIFEPFFTTKPVGKGTGLGLSISYSLIQKHEGRITVDSTPNQGTTFQIHLPIVCVESPAPSPS
ncbi:MAG TPA: ATP-binding protein [Phycisphaerae bacterium]|nr:ATP-binding protein [Phycisphaerae bacterium]